MVFQLSILVVIPIIFGIVMVSPFDSQTQEIEEEIPTENEPEFNFLLILLGLVWFFFLIRILRQILRGTYRIRTRI